MSSSNLLDKKEARIRRMFGQIAPWYDFLNHALSLNIDRAWRTRTARLAAADAADPAPMLDLCTGTGDLALTYHRATGGRVPIIAADFCREMLDRAAAKAHAVGAANLRFVEADAQSLPFPTDSFQLVTVAFGLRNVTDTDRGLAEMVRVTRPGGKVAILEFSRPRSRLFGRMYSFYFRRVLPCVGQLVSRSKENAYTYLPESALRFPDYETLASKLRDHGLIDVTFTPFTLGIATLYVGVKAKSPSPSIEKHAPIFESSSCPGGSR